MIKVPGLVIPIFIIIIIVIAVQYTGIFALPSAEYISTEITGDEAVRQLDWKVKGVKCRGTSEYFINRLKDTGGIISITTYASTNRCVIEYDSLITSAERIKNYIEAPFFNGETGEWIEGIFVVTESVP